MVELLILLGVLASGSGIESLGSESDTDDTDPNAPTESNGTDGSEALAGTTSLDVILGDSGDDTISGDAGNDTIDGGSGDDSLLGGAGDDVLTGFAGVLPETPTDLDDFGNVIGTPDPAIAEGFGADTLEGGAGNDVLFGTVDANADGNFDAEDSDTAADSLDGGEGDDTLYVGNNDAATGGDGADSFVAGTWVDPGSPAVINDFDEAEDTLVIQYQDAMSDTPQPLEVTVETVDSDAVVSLNGQAIMRIIGGGSTVTPAMVSLVETTLS